MKLNESEWVVLQLLWNKPNLIKREIDEQLREIGYSYGHTTIVKILSSLEQQGYINMVENYKTKAYRIEAVPTITKEEYYNQPEDKKINKNYVSLGEWLAEYYRAEVVEVTGDKTFIIHGNYDKNHEDLLFETMKVLGSLNGRVYVERVRR